MELGIQPLQSSRSGAHCGEYVSCPRISPVFPVFPYAQLGKYGDMILVPGFPVRILSRPPKRSLDGAPAFWLGWATRPLPMSCRGELAGGAGLRGASHLSP